MCMKIILFCSTPYIETQNVVNEVSRLSNDIHLINSKLDEGAQDKLDCDLVLCFMTSTILKGNILKIPNINFHPSPPWYRGRGGASLALLEKKSVHGVVAHKMDREIDNGEIYFYDEFEISENDTPETIHFRSMIGSFLQLRKFVSYFKKNKSFPDALDLKWSGDAVSNKDLNDLKMINNIESEEFEQKIRAFSNNNYPGPFVKIKGKTFGYIKD